MTALLWVLALLCTGLGYTVFVLVQKLRRAAFVPDSSGGRSSLHSENNRTRRPAVEDLGPFEALMSASSEAILVLDSEQRVIQANEVARSILREPGRHLIGKTVLQATLSAELSDLAAAALRGIATYGHEARLPGPSGHTLIVSTTPVHSEPGGPECLLVARAITELRKLENVRRDFVANVSHELRTPLASIRAMAETLQDGALYDTTVSARFLETIIRESDRLSRLAQDLLALSTAESGPPSTDIVDISRMLVDLMDRYRPESARAGLTLTESVESGLMVSGSADQLQQVFVNLLDNAIKYTRQGGEVRISAEASEPFANIRVSDTGIGILSEHLDRIFERFYRVDKGRSRDSGGTGLGLSIVRHITESHGGTVSVESDFNVGSTFTVTLPLYHDIQSPNG